MTSGIDRYLIVSLIAAISMGCSSKREVATTLTCICIQDGQIPSYTERALSGDPKAAFALSSTYSFKNESLDTAIYWANIAYLNGDHSVSYWISRLYRRSIEKRHCENELIWLEAYASHIYEVDLIDDIIEIQKREFYITSILKRIDELKEKLQNEKDC